jgi:hypothetical protein
VRVIVLAPDITDALLVPQRAVQDQQGGSYVLVVKADGTVESRPVQLGAVHDGLQQITRASHWARRSWSKGCRRRGQVQKVAGREAGMDGVAAQKDEPAKPESRDGDKRG